MTRTELIRLRLSLMYYSLRDPKVDEPAGRCNHTSSPAVYYQLVITVKAEIVLLPFNKSVSSAMKQSLVSPKSQLPTVSVQFVDTRHSCGLENIFLWHHGHCLSHSPCRSVRSSKRQSPSSLCNVTTISNKAQSDAICQNNSTNDFYSWLDSTQSGSVIVSCHTSPAGDIF